MRKTKEEIKILESIWKSLGLFLAGTSFGTFLFAIMLIQLPSMTISPVSLSFGEIWSFIFSFLVLTAICMYMKVSVRSNRI